MNIPERLAIWIFGTNAKKDVNVVDRVHVKQFDPNNPFIDQGFQMQVNNPNSILDVTVTQIQILSCGHQFEGKISFCTCNKSFCERCSIDTRFCRICNAPLICNSCKFYSRIARGWACRRHRHSWLLGR